MGSELFFRPEMGRLGHHAAQKTVLTPFSPIDRPASIARAGETSKSPAQATLRSTGGKIDQIPAQIPARFGVSMGAEGYLQTNQWTHLPTTPQGVSTMDIILMFGCILIAVTLAGANLPGLLCLFAACQFAVSLAWVFTTSSRKYRRVRFY